LAQLAARLGVPTAVLGTLLIPWNASLISQGSIAGWPGLSFHYDRDTGVPHLFLGDASGSPQLVVQARIGVDGLFRDRDGRAIGRAIDGRDVVIDPDTLPALLSPRITGTAAGDNAGAQARSETRSEPKLCPDPTPEDITRRSERTLLYQQQITGLAPGLEVVFNGQRYDGCRESDGTLLEAKGEGYADLMFGSGYLPEWLRGLATLENQMYNHSRHAGNRLVEYHFAEKAVADWARMYAARKGYDNIIVFYTPLMRNR
jgi:hypothetical protein